MIVRSANPQVIEHPFAELQALITPTDKFYIRDHFSQPHINRDSWRLRVEGAISHPLELSFDDISSMPSRTVIATLECAGNARTFLVPPVPGVQWGLGGVGTAEWTGVPLAAILARAGLHETACDVILEGTDSGKPDPDLGPRPLGSIPFARSLPIEKALDDDVLLAYHMNRRELTIAHGFPLRAIVPGWYAVASIKWLSRIVVSDHPFNGYFQTVDYGFWRQELGGMARVPITTLQLKAEIARPQVDEIIEVDRDYEIFGACWVGESEVSRVEVSVDNGASWDAGTLLGEAVRNAWRLWSYVWHTPSTAQKRVLMARAIDKDGNTQPLHHNQDCGAYIINFCLPITVDVR